MATYPGGIPNLTNPAGTDYMNGPNLHSVQHSNANDEIEAIATELGLNPSGTAVDVATRLNAWSGFRNPVRNGDLLVAQRGEGAGGVLSAAGYCLDGWVKGHIGGTHTAFRDPSGSLGMDIGGAEFCMTSSVTGQSATNHYAYLAQYIESVRSLSGQVTLSFVAKSSANTPKIGIEVIQNFGTGGSASVMNSPGFVTISTTPTRYTMTFNIASFVGKTIGSNNFLQLQFWLSAGSDYNARASNIGIQNEIIYITDIQLEQGPVATPFERLPYQMQLAWNERYLQTLKNTDWNGPTLTRPNSAVSNYYGTLPWRVTPRAYIGTTTTITSITQITQGFNRYDRFPGQLIHKPNVRWDTVSAFQAVISAAGVNIILTPTVDDGYANHGAIFPTGMDFYYSAEL